MQGGRSRVRQRTRKGVGLNEENRVRCSRYKDSRGRKRKSRR